MVCAGHLCAVHAIEQPRVICCARHFFTTHKVLGFIIRNTPLSEPIEVLGSV